MLCVSYLNKNKQTNINTYHLECFQLKGRRSPNLSSWRFTSHSGLLLKEELGKIRGGGWEPHSNLGNVFTVPFVEK